MRMRSSLFLITILAMIFASSSFALSNEEAPVSSEADLELAIQLENLEGISEATGIGHELACSQTITCSASRCTFVEDCDNYPNSTWVNLAQAALQACITSANRDCANRGCGPAVTGIVSGSSETCTDDFLCVNVQLPYSCSN